MTVTWTLPDTVPANLGLDDPGVAKHLAGQHDQQRHAGGRGGTMNGVLVDDTFADYDRRRAEGIAEAGSMEDLPPGLRSQVTEVMAEKGITQEQLDASADEAFAKSFDTPSPIPGHEGMTCADEGIGWYGRERARIADDAADIRPTRRGLNKDVRTNPDGSLDPDTLAGMVAVQSANTKWSDEKGNLINEPGAVAVAGLLARDPIVTITPENMTYLRGASRGGFFGPKQMSDAEFQSFAAANVGRHRLSSLSPEMAGAYISANRSALFGPGNRLGLPEVSGAAFGSGREGLAKSVRIYRGDDSAIMGYKITGFARGLRGDPNIAPADRWMVRGLTRDREQDWDLPGTRTRLGGSGHDSTPFTPFRSGEATRSPTTALGRAARSAGVSYQRSPSAGPMFTGSVLHLTRNLAGGTASQSALAAWSRYRQEHPGTRLTQADIQAMLWFQYIAERS